MFDKTMILTYLVLSTIVVAIKMFSSGRRDPVGFIMSFYLFFGFGPVVSYLFGLPIYFGIVEKNIENACFIMFLGIFSFGLLHILLPVKKVETSGFPMKKHRWGSLNYIFTLSAIYGLVRIALMVPYRLAGASKVELINIALPGIHYVYLLVQLYLTAFYFNIRLDKKLSRLYWLNFVTYILYCLIISERDFIFPVFSILVVKMIATNRHGIKYFFMSLGLVLAATSIFFIRDASQNPGSIAAGILNQGSILFINTYVLEIFSQGQEHFYGSTYINSLINLLPSWIYKTDFNTLSWFHNLYAPASTSGYGYALDAEGYMNFGYPGVVGFFLALSLYWRFLMSRFTVNPFFTYLTVFSTGFCMYSLRNDSLALFKGTLYAIIIYLFVNTTSYLLAIWKKG